MSLVARAAESWFVGSSLLERRCAENRTSSRVGYEVRICEMPICRWRLDLGKRWLLMRRVGAIVGFLLLLYEPLAAFSQEDAQSERDVLRLLREALSRYDSLDLQASARTQFPDGKGGTAVSTLAISVKRLGSRALMSTNDVVDRPGAETSRMREEFLVYENGDVLRCQAKLDSSLKQVDGRNGLALRLDSKRLAGTQQLDRKSVYLALNDAGAALWIIGYAPLLDYLDGASKIEVARGASGTEIVAVGEYGRLKLTASSSSGWLPQSFEIVKEPGHKTFGGLVADLYGNSVRSIVWTGKADGFTSDSVGRWVPAKMDVQRRTERKEKPAETDRITIDFEHVTFDPPLTASDFRIGIVAPVGYPVFVIGANHLPYKWDGQAVVPGVPNMPPRLNQQVEYKNLEKSGRPNRTLTVLILFNVLLVLIFIVVLWRRRGASR